MMKKIYVAFLEFYKFIVFKMYYTSMPFCEFSDFVECNS